MISGKTNRKLAILIALALALPLALAGCLGGEPGAGGDNQTDTGDQATAEVTGHLADCISGIQLEDDGEDAADGSETADGNETADGDQTTDGGDEAGGNGITIGTILPLTGALQAYGPSMEKATDLAAKQLNEAGGILGGDVTLAHEDSASDPNQAPQAFNKLVNQANVVGVVGAASSGVTSTLLSAAGENNVLLVSPASTSPALTPDKADGYFFRTVPSDALQGEVLAGLIEACGDAGTVNTIAINNDYGTGFVNVMDGLLGLNEKVFYDQNAQTFDSEVQRVCSGNPSAIAFIGYPEEGSIIMQQAYSEGCTDIPWYFSEGLKDPAFVEGAGTGDVGTPLIAGFGGTFPWSAPNQGNNFVQAYKDEYEQDPGLFADTSYDATILIALAAQKAGGVDNGQALIDAMMSLKDGQGEKISEVSAAVQAVKNGQEIDWVGPSGDYTFDDSHSPAEALYGVWGVADNGQIQELLTGIEPGELASS